MLRLDVETRERQSQEEAAVFYAQSWALAEMLVLSPDYQPRLRALISSLASGLPGDAALVIVYGRTGGICRRRFALLDRSPSGPIVRLDGAAPGHGPRCSRPGGGSGPCPFVARRSAAGRGRVGRAEPLYRDLLRDLPRTATSMRRSGRSHSSRATARPRNGNGGEPSSLVFPTTPSASATRSWRRTPARPPKRSADPPAGGRHAAAVDDARYSLALLLKNAGDADAAVGICVPGRKSRGPSLCVLDGHVRRPEFPGAFRRGRGGRGDRRPDAPGAEEMRASELASIARTEVAVQLDRGTDGRERMVTTRAPPDLRLEPFCPARRRRSPCGGPPS